LRRTHPLLDVELVCNDQLADLVADRIDVAIRLGTLADSSYRAARLGSYGRGLVASPAFLAQHGMPADFAALARLPFVAHTVLAQPAVFTLAAADGQSALVRMARTSFSSNTASACRAAALAGDGVALMSDFSVRDDVASGALVRLFADWGVAPAPIHALYPSAAHVPQRVRVLLDALKSQ